ncbi:hypothetical protein BCR43DRAFT_23310 [Syncephalastrum racemosum]|uniref:Uncharacterized protein n=1 Tax=Syncephalastrum racemosum TaxID=13706 RepID=A0A1X2HT69_SYNRA|nr:hypothetical protein BCR43DRAFT_23310 [Syncephalastrum racemosum]
MPSQKAYYQQKMLPKSINGFRKQYKRTENEWSVFLAQISLRAAQKRPSQRKASISTMAWDTSVRRRTLQNLCNPQNRNKLIVCWKQHWTWRKICLLCRKFYQSCTGCRSLPSVYTFSESQLSPMLNRIDPAKSDYKAYRNATDDEEEKSAVRFILDIGIKAVHHKGDITLIDRPYAYR